MKKTVLSLLLLLPFLVMGQANPYSVEEFLQLFPKVNPVGLHVYFAGSEENYYPESVQSDRPVGRFIGTPLETSRCKILADAKICDFDYYYEEILKNTFVDYGPMAYAVARFDLDNDHQALIIRHYGEYEVSQISLFVWDNNSQKFEGQVSLANSSGDAGEMWEHESWISIEKGVLVVKTHDIWYYGDIDVYFDELGTALESGDTTKLPINKMTEFHSKMMVNRWMPEGWEKKKVGDIAEFKRGKTITKKDIVEGNVPVVAGGLEPAYYCNKHNTASRVITISGSGANAGFTRLYYEKVWASDCSFADTNTTKWLHFVYCFLQSSKSAIDNMQKGAAQPHVYAKDINALDIIVPEAELLSGREGLLCRDNRNGSKGRFGYKSCQNRRIFFTASAFKEC